MKQNAIVKGKIVECCIGFFFLIPPIIGVIAFLMNWYGDNPSFTRLYYMNENWIDICGYNGDGRTTNAPIYLGMMAMVGAYLIKDSVKYIFMIEWKKKKEPKTIETEQSDPTTPIPPSFFHQCQQ